MKCFYHSADLDGRCSAAIVLRSYPGIELVGIDYGEPFPWDSIDPSEAPIFMVDFSLQPFSEMLKLREKLGESLIWIDHHKGVIEERDAAPEPNKWHGVQKDGIGACVLTWEYLRPWVPVPWAVKLLGQYDVFDLSNPDCEPFQYGMRMQDQRPEGPLWDTLLRGHQGTLGYILRDGAVAMRYQKMQSAGHARALCFEAEVDGLRVLAANTGPAGSSFFESVWNPDRYDAMCLFQWRPKIGQWTVSFYTDKPEVDCSVICKARGGNGHRGAAGFQSREIPDFLKKAMSQGQTDGEANA